MYYAGKKSWVLQVCSAGEENLRTDATKALLTTGSSNGAAHTHVHCHLHAPPFPPEPCWPAKVVRLGTTALGRQDPYSVPVQLLFFSCLSLKLYF